jgi:hypothetical protein
MPGMKSFPLALIAALVGAVGFHLHYLSVDRDARCLWDRRLGSAATDACRMDAVAAQYDPAARRRLDALVADAAE